MEKEKQLKIEAEQKRIALEKANKESALNDKTKSTNTESEFALPISNYWITKIVAGTIALILLKWFVSVYNRLLKLSDSLQ